MRWIVVTAATLLALAGCEEVDGTPLGVTLDDGQVLVGAVRTETLHLKGGLGMLNIPLKDVGVVLPVEGDRLGDANNHVTVWLRNGSELRGEWAEPELSLAVATGDRDVLVDLPLERMQAIQTRGGEIWPAGAVYRVGTTWGDDFLVDADASQLVVENELGVFSPWLSECVSAAPIDRPEGDWRVELTNGSVLIGPLADGELVFALPMGPETLTVPLEQFVSMERQSWQPSAAPPEAAEPAQAWDTGGHEPAKLRARPGLSSSAGWFDQRGLEYEKSRH